MLEGQEFFQTPDMIGQADSHGRRPPSIMPPIDQNLAARTLGLREIGAIRSDGFSEVRENGRWLGRLSLQTPRIIAANSKQGIQNAIK